MPLLALLLKILTFFANASFDWVVISGEDGSPLAVGGFHQTLGRQVVFSLSHFLANPVSLMQEFFLCLLDILYFFPGREQSSWLLCLTVKRRTSIRWGKIFPFLILSTHIAKTNFFIILIGDQPASWLENFCQFFDLDWRKVWNYFVYLEEFQRFLRLSAVKSLEITCWLEQSIEKTRILQREQDTLQCSVDLKSREKCRFWEVSRGRDRQGDG